MPTDCPATLSVAPSTTQRGAAASLEAFLRREIPLAGAMQLELHAWSGEAIEVRAPLAPNVNDKGCAFGGSLASLMTLAPWSVLELSLRAADLEADIFVADAQISYLAPIFEDIVIKAAPQDGESLQAFRDTLRKRGRARIKMSATVSTAEGTACVQHARFVAKMRHNGSGQANGSHHA